MKKLSPEQKERHLRRLRYREAEFFKNRRIKSPRKPKPVNKRVNSPLLEYLRRNNFSDVKEKTNIHYYTIEVPTTFSFASNPRGVLKTLAKMVHAVNDCDIKELYINHLNCKEIDLGASTVMDVIVLAAKKEWEEQGKDVVLKGTYSKYKKVNEILKITGLLKHIEHSDSKVPKEVLQQYDTYELVRGEKDKVTGMRSTQAEFVTTNLTDYFDRLLKKFEFELTDPGKNRISKLIGEVLDNCEQHSNVSEWYAIGYMENNTCTCTISIFNFGDTIAQTLSTAPLNASTKDNMLRLIKQHIKNGYFRVRDEWDKNNLWTLFALQEGISRFNNESVTDRGHGTVSMIEFFLNLSTISETKKPGMVLLSGNTYILFDGKYHLSDVIVDDEKRQVIAFNDNNNLQEKPDSKYVRKIKGYFPGTMISMKFDLSKDYLIKIYEQHRKRKQNND